MIIPIQWQIAGALIIAVAAGTVVAHYMGLQSKLDVIYAEGKAQKAHVKVVEVKQAEVVKNVGKSTQDAIAASDAYWRLHLKPGSGTVPGIAGAPESPATTSPTTPPDPVCNPQDGAADALEILGWQQFYAGLRDAQKEH